MFKSELLEPVFSTCQKMLDSVLLDLFCRLLEPMPEITKSELLEPISSTSGTLEQGQKMLKSTRLGSILSTSGPKARKCSNRNSWNPFCRLLCPLQENAEIGTPGAILSMSGPNAGKCLNRNSWNPFCRRLVPMPENTQIGAPGAHLVDF